MTSLVELSLSGNNIKVGVPLKGFDAEQRTRYNRGGACRLVVSL